MRQAWVAIVVVASALLLAGCISGADDVAEQAADTVSGGADEELQTEQQRFTHEASEGGSATWSVQTTWTVDAPGTLLGAAASLETEQTPTEWRLAVVGPDGETTYLHPGPRETSAESNLTDPQAGTYDLELQARGPRVPQAVDVGFDYAWQGAADAGGAQEAADVRFERTDDGQWRAIVTYRASADAADSTQVQVETFNGAVALATAGDRTEATVSAYGEADTKERARTLASDVEVTLRASPADVVAQASQGQERTGDDEGQGAHVDVRTPARVTGSADTDNGAVRLEDLRAGRLEATTNNGRVGGTVADAGGDLALRTNNGAVEVDVTPTTSLTLEAGTDNGRVDLGLAEGPGIGYELDSSVGNGRMTEDMQEASFEDRQDRTTGAQATLRTDGYEDRATQVSGSAGTGNGRLHYQGR